MSSGAQEVLLIGRTGRLPSTAAGLDILTQHNDNLLTAVRYKTMVEAVSHHPFDLRPKGMIEQLLPFGLPSQDEINILYHSLHLDDTSSDFFSYSLSVS